MNNLPNDDNDQVNEEETSPPSGGTDDDTELESRSATVQSGNIDDDIDENQPEYKNATIVAQGSTRSHFETNPMDQGFKATIKETKDSTLQYTNWTIENSPPPKPELFELERTTFAVEEDVPTLAKKLQNILKLRSVHVQFEGASAKCKTADFTKFHLNLYDAGDGKVNVEVQRRNGCSMAFRDEYLEIIKVVDGLAVKTPDQVAEERKPKTSLKEALGDKYIPLPDGIVEKHIQMALKSLQTKKPDQVLFAMKDLVSISGSSETCLEAAQILLGDDKYEEIRAHILAIICDHEQDEESKEYSRNVALTLFANIMGALSDAKILAKYIENDVFTRHIVTELMKDINKETAAQFPANVCLTLKCLFYLITNSPAARKTAHDFGDAGLVLVNDVRDHGSKCYLNLEKEATNVYENL